MTREEAYELVSISSRYDAYDNYNGYNSNIEEVIDIIYDYFEQQIEAQAYKICSTCRYNNECYTYRDIATEQSTFFLSCAYYKPKEKE